MSVFGKNEPKIKTSGDVEIEIDNVVVINDHPDVVVKTFIEQFSGHKEKRYYGRHWVYEIRVNLFKYADPATSYNTFKGVLFDEVTLWRHRDGDQFKKPDGDDAKFYVSNVDIKYLEQNNYNDYLIIKFESAEIVNVLENFDRFLIKEDESGYILTSDGNRIILG